MQHAALMILVPTTRTLDPSVPPRIIVALGSGTTIPNNPGYLVVL